MSGAERFWDFKRAGADLSAGNKRQQKLRVLADSGKKSQKVIDNKVSMC